MDEGPKLSAASSIGFRPGHLREKLEALHSDLRRHDANIRLSDILRDGLTAFWPQIEAYLRARQETRVAPEVLTRLVGTCGRAIELGVTPEEVEAQLNTALEAHLAVNSAPSVEAGAVLVPAAGR